ncbi:MAG: ferrous iron transport protein B [Pyrinomonadaceae bacterium]
MSKHEKENSSPIVALAGNPNAGKTTLFNGLTGLRQKTANYSGVTVERKEGNWKAGSEEVRLIDLPGLYSLDATSLDEEIAREVLTGTSRDIGKPDVIIAVVDATNLERNLYLVTQLMSYRIPVVVALSMMDLARKRNLQIDTKKLSEMLEVPVVVVTASRKQGLRELSDVVESLVLHKEEQNISWLRELGEDVDDIHLSLTDDAGANRVIFARYSFISRVYQDSVRLIEEDHGGFSEKLDKVLTNRFFGLIILAAILLLIFQAIFTWATVPMDYLDSAFGAFGEFVRSETPPGILSDLLVDGIIAGVGGVLIFLPQILLLFLFVSILEDTGYMARAAFLLDRLMSRVGLHGKAFLPLMSSFACAIPGIMATRTIENKRDRLATILIAPFMSCSARLPVYSLMIAAFFTGKKVFGYISMGAVLMLGMYLLGIVIALVFAFIFKKTILSSPPPPFVMELPPYRLPNFRSVFQNIFTRGWIFVKRAGTVIFAISILLWALVYFPHNSGKANGVPAKESAQIEDSFAGRLGKTIEPAIAPLGFNWQIGIGIVASFAAREVLVSTLSIIYNVGDDVENSKGLINALQTAKNDDGTLVWTPLTALSLMIFFVLAMQCMSTLAVVRRETNSWGWALFMFTYMTLIAYIASFITYQGGRMLGFS